MAEHIIKREGHEEHFDQEKVRITCSRACSNAHLSKDEIKKICDNITEYVCVWIGKQPREVSSEEIFDIVFNHLQKYNSDAAFMYRTHRDIS